MQVRYQLRRRAAAIVHEFSNPHVARESMRRAALIRQPCELPPPGDGEHGVGGYDAISGSEVHDHVEDAARECASIGRHRRDSCEEQFNALGSDRIDRNLPEGRQDDLAKHVLDARQSSLGRSPGTQLDETGFCDVGERRVSTHPFECALDLEQ